MTAEVQFRARAQDVPGVEIAEPLSRLYRQALLCDASGALRWAGADAPARQRPLCELTRALRGTGSCRGAPHEPRGFVVAQAELGGGEACDLTLFPLRGSRGESLHVVIARAISERGAPTGPQPICDAHPVATLGVDADGFIRYANRAAGELVGLDPQCLTGAAAAALARDTEGMVTLVEALAGADDSAFALPLRRTAGEPITVAVTITRLSGEDGGAVLALQRLEDRVLSELARRNDELEHCVTTVAHDLRSPLVALLGFSRLLRQDYGEQLDATGAHFLDRIEQSGRTMEALVRDLLELSRIGQPGELPGPVDPRGVLQQVCAELKPRLDEAGLQLLLPEDPPLVHCDRTRLYQIFSNLLANAIDHTGNPVDRRVLVSIEENEDHHCICVRDFGRGVPADHRERIFEPFQSLGIRRDHSRGTGMGLAIVRRIAESRGGAAWVESPRSAGARFLVTLPHP